MFSKQISNHLNINSSLKRKLATELGIAESTVERWSNNSSIPHPKIQKIALEICEKENEIS